MQNLAITARAAQLIAHNMHNLVEGCTFFSDHEFLGGLYETYEGIYDDVVERMIGLGVDFDINQLNRSAMAEALQYDVSEMDSCDMFELLLTIEANIRKWAESYDKESSYGSRNFLQGIADDSEKRTYKIGQRTKGIDEDESTENEAEAAAETEPTVVNPKA